VPSANIIGRYFTGHLTFGQLLDDEGNGSDLTVQNLISQASGVIDGGGAVSLHSHVRDTSTLVFVDTTNSPASPEIVGPFLDEIVHYVVIPRMAANITQNANPGNVPNRQDYTFLGSVASNWVAFP